MTEFRITFGQKYRSEPHGTLGMVPELPDGWATIEGSNQIEVRETIRALIDSEYAFLYEPGDLGYPTLDVYEKGSLGSLESLVAYASLVAEQEAVAIDLTFGVQVSLDPNGWLDLHLDDLTTEMKAAGVAAEIVEKFEAVLGRKDAVPRIIMVDRAIATGPACSECGAFGYCHHR